MTPALLFLLVSQSVPQMRDKDHWDTKRACYRLGKGVSEVRRKCKGPVVSRIVVRAKAVKR